MRPSAAQILQELPELLETLLGELPEVRFPSGGPDLVADVDGVSLVVECKHSGDGAPVAAGVAELKRYATGPAASAPGRVVAPLLVVPFMSGTGRRLCEEADVNWLDLSGNARIIVPPRLRIWIDGRPNKFKRPGRPRTVFSPKATRIVRLLLFAPHETRTQREIAEETGLSEGHVSRLVRRMEEDAMVERDEDGGVRPADPLALLDQWREASRFDRNEIHRGHVAVRSGEELVDRLHSAFRAEGFRYALTGLAAAWLYESTAMFRTVTCYVERMPDDAAMRDLGYRPGERGANLWLVVPRDEGVFMDSEVWKHVPCAAPVQTYVDLKDQPERAPEASEALRQSLVRAWSERG